VSVIAGVGRFTKMQVKRKWCRSRPMQFAARVTKRQRSDLVALESAKNPAFQRTSVVELEPGGESKMPVEHPVQFSLGSRLKNHNLFSCQVPQCRKTFRYRHHYLVHVAEGRHQVTGCKQTR